jgi:SAM-dependent methyltransferase
MRTTIVPSIQPEESVSVPSAKRAPEEVFEECLQQIISPGDFVLDAGCGAGKFFRADFAKRTPCRLLGIDLQPSIGVNDKLDLRARADVRFLPFAGNSVDVVICRWVVEHLRKPELALREFHRVLKPSGSLALFTPNLLHYYGAAASLTPHWFHVWFNRRARGFEETDIFPTYYRANTRRRLHLLLTSAGFRRLELTLVEGGPSALEFNRLLHGAGRLYEKAVNRFDWLSSFRMNLIAIAHKY